MLGDGSSPACESSGAFVQRGGAAGAIVERGGPPQPAASARLATQQAAESLLRSKALEATRAAQRSCATAGGQSG
eukprot:2981725-Lingulodinium_polyedra.AAC.1